MIDTRKTPRLRFPGFTDDWEQRKLSDISSLITKGTTPLDKSGMGSINFVKVENIDASSGIITPETKISEEEHNGYLRRSRLQENDILFSIAGTLGRVSVVKSSILPANTNQALAIIRTKEGDISYLITALRGNVVAAFIRRNPTVGAQPNLSLEQVSNLEIPYPSLEEQKRIGVFFNNLDNLITLHQRKLDQMKRVKLGMLQKMFPREGETVPEKRFPGFTGDWKQRKLESLCEVFTDGDWVEAKDQSDSGIRLVQTGNVGTTEYIDKPNSKKWVSEETFERLRCEEIYAGDILISRLPEPAGRACIMPDLGTRMITAVDCTIVRTSRECDSKFLVQYLSTPMYFKVVNSFLGGGTRQRISRGNLSGMDIPLPQSLAEQKAIGEYFEKFDKLITYQQLKIDQMKEYKKGLLQQMYI